MDRISAIMQRLELENIPDFSVKFEKIHIFDMPFFSYIFKSYIRLDIFSSYSDLHLIVGICSD